MILQVGVEERPRPPSLMSPASSLRRFWETIRALLECGKLQNRYFLESDTFREGFLLSSRLLSSSLLFLSPFLAMPLVWGHPKFLVKCLVYCNWLQLVGSGWGQIRVETDRHIGSPPNKWSSRHEKRVVVDRTLSENHLKCSNGIKPNQFEISATPLKLADGLDVYIWQIW